MAYYRSHWVDIEPERLAIYDATYQWNPLAEPFIQGIGLETAQCLVDFGTGPGWTALEMANRMPDGAKIHGCDINDQLLGLAEQHGMEMGLKDKMNWHHVINEKIPLPDDSADCLFCRNTLAYVSSMDDMLAEFKRVLKPGGMVRVIDSDWDLFAVEPSNPDTFKSLMEHAKHAFRDPQAGRHLYVSTKRAGFKEVEVTMFPVSDTFGILIGSPVKNLAVYAVDGGFPSGLADRFILDCQEALEKEELIIIMPMFMITAKAP